MKGKRGAGLESSLPVFDKIKSELKLDKSDYILYSHRSYFWTNIEDKHINVANEYLNLFNFENDQMLLNSDFRDILYKKK